MSGHSKSQDLYIIVWRGCFCINRIEIEMREELLIRSILSFESAIVKHHLLIDMFTCMEIQLWESATSYAAAPRLSKIYWHCQQGQVRPERLISISQ